MLDRQENIQNRGHDRSTDDGVSRGERRIRLGLFEVWKFDFREVKEHHAVNSPSEAMAFRSAVQEYLGMCLPACVSSGR